MFIPSHPYSSVWSTGAFQAILKTLTCWFSCILFSVGHTWPIREMTDSDSLRAVIIDLQKLLEKMYYYTLNICLKTWMSAYILHTNTEGTLQAYMRDQDSTVLVGCVAKIFRVKCVYSEYSSLWVVQYFTTIWPNQHHTLENSKAKD